MEFKQELVDEILVNFYAHNVHWRIGGLLNEPTEADVRKVLDTLYSIVYDGEDQIEASTGGILMKKDDGHFDVYLHIGEL